MSAYDVVDFEEFVATRMKNETLEETKKILKADDKQEEPKYYGKLSNYIRVAVIQLNRREKQRLNLDEPRGYIKRPITPKR